MAATNQTRGLLTQLVGGYCRHLSAEKLCLIKRDPFLHHMESGNRDFMSQYAVGNHSGRITFSPVGMFVPEFFQLGIISDCYTGSLRKRKLQVMVPLIASFASFHLVGGRKQMENIDRLSDGTSIYAVLACDLVFVINRSQTFSK